MRAGTQSRFEDLRAFLNHLETRGELRRVDAEVDPRLEITEVCRRTLQREGPALRFTRPTGSDIDVLGNLFGTASRIAAALGSDSTDVFGELGQLLASLRAPEPPRSAGEVWQKLPLVKEVLKMAPQTARRGPCQENVIEGKDVDLGDWPIQTCWPEDAGPLITWGLTTTRSPAGEAVGKRQNVGIYRQQVIGRNRIIMRWLPHRGGATDYKAWCARHPEEPFEVAISIGAGPGHDPGSRHADSRYPFRIRFRRPHAGGRTQLVKCIGSDLRVPATAEITLEGHIASGDTAMEGPFGDHTGYYTKPSVSR